MPINALFNIWLLVLELPLIYQSRPFQLQEGSFVSNGFEYNMELLDDRSNARVRRDTSQLWSLAKNVVSSANEMSKVYGIFRTEKKGGAPSDFKEESKEFHIYLIIIW